MLGNLEERVNGNAWLVHRGRYLDTQFLFEAGPDAWLVRIHAGRVESVQAGPFVMPSWTFAFRAEVDTWRKFWEPEPRPGFHDLLAMLKFGTLKIEGDPYPFMSNLLYFKDVLGTLRRAA
jgi:hypothetical protein